MQAAQAAPTRKLVFLCDDDADIAEVTQLILEEEMHEVMLFSVCEGIVEQAEKYQPSLILMDLWMPEMGGEKVIQLLKQNPKTRHIPVYIFSATRDADLVLQRSGADGLFSKPYDIEDLHKLLKKIDSSIS